VDWFDEARALLRLNRLFSSSAAESALKSALSRAWVVFVRLYFFSLVSVEAAAVVTGAPLARWSGTRSSPAGFSVALFAGDTGWREQRHWRQHRTRPNRTLKQKKRSIPLLRAARRGAPGPYRGPAVLLLSLPTAHRFGPCSTRLEGLRSPRLADPPQSDGGPHRDTQPGSSTFPVLAPIPTVCLFGSSQGKHRDSA